MPALMTRVTTCALEAARKEVSPAWGGAGSLLSDFVLALDVQGHTESATLPSKASSLRGTAPGDHRLA